LLVDEAAIRYVQKRAANKRTRSKCSANLRPEDGAISINQLPGIEAPTLRALAAKTLVHIEHIESLRCPTAW
jgi:hypothetical protein